MENIEVERMGEIRGCFQKNLFFRSVSINRKSSFFLLRVVDIGKIGGQYMAHTKNGF